MIVRRIAVVIAAAAACSSAPSDPPDPAPALALPGALWFQRDGALVRCTGGECNEVARGEVALYPSRVGLPGGGLLAIASRGDGSPQSEQLVAIAGDGSQRRVGPSAPMVRDPAQLADGTVVVAIADGERSELFRVELATGQSRQLTDNREGNFAPAAAGGDIIYVSSRDGNAEIYRNQQRLTAFHKDDWAPEVSSRGDIAFVSDREGLPRVFVMASDGTHQQRLTAAARDAGDERDAVWSPDGTQISYVVARGATRVIHVRDVVTGRDTIVYTGASDDAPTWSPDGAWLAFARRRGVASVVTVVRLADRATIELGRGQLPRWVG